MAWARMESASRRRRRARWHSAGAGPPRHAPGPPSARDPGYPWSVTRRQRARCSQPARRFRRTAAPVSPLDGVLSTSTLDAPMLTNVTDFLVTGSVAVSPAYMSTWSPGAITARSPCISSVVSEIARWFGSELVAAPTAGREIGAGQLLAGKDVGRRDLALQRRRVADRAGRELAGDDRRRLVELLRRDQVARGPLLDLAGGDEHGRLL